MGGGSTLGDWKIERERTNEARRRTANKEITRVSSRQMLAPWQKELYKGRDSSGGKCQTDNIWKSCAIGVARKTPPEGFERRERARKSVCTLGQGTFHRR